MRSKFMQKEPVLAVGYLIIVMLCVVRVVTSKRIKMPLIMVAILSILSIISVHIILSVLVASSTPTGANRHEVRMTMNSYDPAYLSVKKGTKVTFRNLDVVPHTATSGDGTNSASTGKIFDTGLINTGQAVDITFNVAGEFKYFCTIHPTMMHGVIIVT